MKKLALVLIICAISTTATAGESATETGEDSPTAFLAPKAPTYFELLHVPQADQNLMQAIYWAHKSHGLTLKFIAEDEMNMATWITSMRTYYDDRGLLTSHFKPPIGVDYPPKYCTFLDFIYWWIDNIPRGSWNEPHADYLDLWWPLVPKYLKLIENENL